MARLPRLPDLLTSANLGCGVVSILMASHGALTAACWLVFVAALFDVFDGLAARVLGGGSELGKQLDSLADVVSFGVAPGIIVFHFLGQPLSTFFLSLRPDASAGLEAYTFLKMQAPGILLALVIPVAAAWRLAKFNIDPRQDHGFLGLPSPANALFWAGLVPGLAGMDHLPSAMQGPVFTGILVGLVFILSGLMLTELPLPSLKFRKMQWRGNEVVFILAAIGVVLVPWFGFLAVPLLVIVYLLSPLWGKLFPKPE